MNRTIWGLALEVSVEVSVADLMQVRTTLNYILDLDKLINKLISMRLQTS